MGGMGVFHCTGVLLYNLDLQLTKRFEYAVRRDRYSATVCCCQGVIIILPLKMFGESSKTETFTPILINTEYSYYMYIVIKTQIEG